MTVTLDATDLIEAYLKGMEDATLLLVELPDDLIQDN